MKGKIIFLNGTSSSGKTTLARCLQASLDEVYYHIAADDFLHMMDEQKLEKITYDCFVNTVSAMHHTVKLFSDRGLNVIVDHVLLDTPELAFATPECVKLLHDSPVLFVRVDCDLAELERREKARGDREAGMAKWQTEHIHGNQIYDVQVNTARQTTDQCVQVIRRMLDKPEEWTAFEQLYMRIG
ncbi:MAG TPA: AAA family ATPase [Candidatus Limiplasma sp.]|nr:AAA family ATPase [Candidatus Limiplasma sp.]